MVVNNALCALSISEIPIYAQHVKAIHVSCFSGQIEQMAMAILEEIYNDGALKGELTVIPGFRFYPTEEELVSFYLKKRVQGGHQLNFDIIIPTLDLYRYDPWELPGLAMDVGEKQWFFFVPRESKKCARPATRLTVSGYWKATGSDRAIRNELLQCVGLKKTLVFYKGKAPLGQRTDWIMNEYRLPDLSLFPPKIKKTDMVICRIYKKAACHKSMEQRTKSVSVEKGKLVVSAPDEYEQKCHSISVDGSSCQSSPMTEATISTLHYNANKGVYFNFSKMNNEDDQFEFLEPIMSSEGTPLLNVGGVVPTHSYIQLCQGTVNMY